jgi:hypothetical protein
MYFEAFLLGLLNGTAVAGVFALAASLLGLLMPRPPRVNAEAGTVILSHRGMVRGLAALFAALVLLFVGAFARQASAEPMPPVGWAVAGAFLAVLLPAAACLLLAGFRSRVALCGAGLTHRPGWGTTRHLRWEEITEVSCSGGYYVFRGAGERRLRLSAWFDGLPLLWEALEQFCPPPAGAEAVPEYEPRPELEGLTRRAYLTLIGQLDRARLARVFGDDDAGLRRELRVVAELLFSQQAPTLSPLERSRLVEEVLDMALPRPPGGEAPREG